MLLSLLTVLLLSVPAFAAEPFGHDDNAGVTVMTRNMYFGADLTPALVATTPFDFIAAVTSIFGIVNASDVANRIDRMAEEIARTKPDLVGLQEVAIWRTQFPPDFSPTPNATAVVYDFLALLLARLEALGARYDVVATHVTNDLEAPAFFPGFACCFEVRFTDQEVILARANHGLNLSNVQDGTFATQVFFTVPGAPAPYVEKRGWLSVDVKKGNDQFRFITTHLLPEGFFDPAQVGQGFELLTGPANTSGNVILVCDCNSRADNTGTATYGLLLGAGFGDVWSARHPADPGFSCCQAENLLNPVSALDQRIDLILFRGAAQVEAVALTGASPGDQTAAGRWPSDHAGVVGTVDFRR
ncbi:MAG TPA: endonuclease/exonuclease/phosphatase family protein [Methylomirabilota bacterium]|nr:endonuclease/exonuclease/phosphatase family protein [Methylomirabilota bacterium]